mmetsp:Transcript_17565/g.36210  ORF Transcript_17565/g.36210 Transcript_17565/m.36210 type:complete len:237 (+) Transcript_17565:272-982(+)
MQDHASWHSLRVAIMHRAGQRPGASEDIQIGKLFLSPEPSPSVADSGVVTKHLREGSTIQTLKDNKTNLFAGPPGTNQLHNVGVVDTRVNGYFGFDFVNGNGSVLTFGPQRLDHHGLSVKDGRVDPRVASIRQILDVHKLSPLQIQPRSRHGRLFGSSVRNRAGTLHVVGSSRQTIGRPFGKESTRRRTERARVAAIHFGFVQGAAWRTINQSVRRQGIDRGDGGTKGHVNQKFDG